eukprot:6173767-Pleurochrysis_carterae.AAC.2
MYSVVQPNVTRLKNTEGGVVKQPRGSLSRRVAFAALAPARGSFAERARASGAERLGTSRPGPACMIARRRVWEACSVSTASQQLQLQRDHRHRCCQHHHDKFRHFPPSSKNVKVAVEKP